MHWDSKILLIVPLKRCHPSYKPKVTLTAMKNWHCKKDGISWGGQWAVFYYINASVKSVVIRVVAFSGSGLMKGGLPYTRGTTVLVHIKMTPDTFKLQNSEIKFLNKRNKYWSKLYTWRVKNANRHCNLWM